MTAESTTTPIESGPSRVRLGRLCGHSRHVGVCPTCQRAQLERWRAQLLQASTHCGGVSAARPPSSYL